MIKKSFVLMLTLLICLFPFGCDGSCALKGGGDSGSGTSQSGSLGSTDGSSSPSDESSSSSGRPNELPLLPINT